MNYWENNVAMEESPKSTKNILPEMFDVRPTKGSGGLDLERV